jgi:5-bromo-4-chloroindolyl phosphate hydrolysis protein
MPLGGYCNVCGRWVWLTPYGECQNGHPATAVRDVQQLRPRAAAAPDVPVPQTPRARFRWWWRHSLWISWTFTAGFLNWVAFVYIGVRARHLPWSLLGFVYLAPLILTILAIGTPLFQIMVALQLVVSAVSVVNALYLRPYYRAIMFGDVPPRALPAPPQPPPLVAANQRPQLPRTTDEATAEVLQPARRQVDAILRSAAGIAKLDAARGFLTYYLDAAQRIVDGYVHLLARGSSSAEIGSTLRRAEDSLRIVQQAFDRQLASVLEDSALDLDSEIELLERTVRTETMFTQTGEL